MIATILDRASGQLGEFLPRLGGALLLFIAGLLAASIVGRITRKALVRAGLDRLAERTGASQILGRGGLGGSLSALVATAVRLTIIVVASFAALTLLGLAFLSDSLNEGILFIPRLLTALALVLIGIVVAALVRAWLERTSAQLDFLIAIGPVGQVLVVLSFGLCAAAQAGVTVAPLIVVALVVMGAIAATLALAFGRLRGVQTTTLNDERMLFARLRTGGWALRVPRCRQELALRIERARDELATSLGHQPTIAELSRRLRLDQELVLQALEVALARRTFPLEPSLPRTEADDMPGDLDAGYRRVEDRAVLVRLLATLSVFLRFTADLTQDVIARRLGVSQMYVSRALRRSLSMLRDAAG